MGRPRIDWKLITDLPVDSHDAAVEKLQWYAMRWKIEVFHKIMKSGCRVEQARLRTAERRPRLPGPNEYIGEAVKAFVKLEEGQALDAEALKSFLADKLGRHEMPKHVEFHDELPKTMIGKLSRKELVAEEEAAREAATG